MVMCSEKADGKAFCQPPEVPVSDRMENDRDCLPFSKQYFSSSRATSTLAVLDALSNTSELSQRELARRLDVSVAVINQLLRDLQSRGLLLFEARNGKSYRYILTADGKRLRVEMLSLRKIESINIYSALKDHIRNIATKLCKKNILKICLFGASETCEVVLMTLFDMPFRVVAIMDNDTSKHGTLFHGYIVSHPQVLDSVDAQAVLLTTFGRQREIREQIQPLCRAKGMEIVSL